MNYKELKDDDLDILMEKIRNIIDTPRSEEISSITTQDQSNSININDYRKEQIWNEVEELIADASIGRKIGLELPPMYKMKGFKRNIAKLIGKVFLRLSQIFTRDLREFNHSILNILNLFKGSLYQNTERINSLENHIDELLQKSKIQSEQLEIMSKQLNTIKQEIKDYEGKLLNHEEKFQNHEEKFQNHEEKFQNHEEKFLNHEEKFQNYEEKLHKQIIEKVNFAEKISKDNNVGYLELKQIIKTQNNAMRADKNQDALTVEKSLDYDKPIMSDEMYNEFQELFRGSRADIKRRLEIYLPIIKESKMGRLHSPIIDLGCGRGEWIELLKENSIHAVGIDSNEVQIEKCKEYGLEAICSDALAFLKNQEDNSVGGVTGFHIVEHLPTTILFELLEESYRVLKSGGIIIFETPNPQNLIVGAANFYMDPTHQKPIPSQLLKYYAERFKFQDVNIVFANPMHESRFLSKPIELGANDAVWDQNIMQLNELLYGAQDYAVVGCKR